MTRRATKTPRARRDLAEIAANIGFENPPAADQFLDAARDAFVKLVDFPLMGARRDTITPRYPKLRSWPIKNFENYLIFYTPTTRGIRVLRVLHGARNLEAVFKT